VPLIVSYDVSDRFRFYGEGMLDITYQAGEFKDEGVKLSSHWAAGALVRF